MESDRLRKVVCSVLVVGTVAACTGERLPRGDREVAGDPPSAAAATVDAPVSGPSVPSPAWGAPWSARPGGPSLLEHVTDRARSLAASPWQPPETLVTEAVADLTYGQMRGVRFRGEEAVWRGGGRFQLQLFHPGGGNDVPVRIHLVEDGESRSLPFDPSLFLYGDEVEGMDLSLPGEAGYAGFRVLHPLNHPDRWDEVVSFLGASYFRLLGPGQVYGLSARGIAVDVAGPGDEEFPDFREFWVVRPEPGADSLRFLALLDGPSITGAFAFVLHPGSADAPDAGPTELEVEARLFARERVEKLGVAPLTSMYLHGTFRPGGDDDFRPRVHDSEGLLMQTSRGEWIWRPLTNRPRLRVTSLRDVDPAGFALVQRSREFRDYLDLEAEYHRRPSLRVVPEGGGWGAGGVELVEIPTTSEFNDNIVVSWVPDGPFPAGEERSYAYRLVTFDQGLEEEGVARVVRTRIGWDALPGQADPPPRSRRRVVLDFAGGGLENLPADAPLEPVATTTAGTLSDLRVRVLPDGGRRVTFAVTPDGDRPADMRVLLRSGDNAVTETWSYLLEMDT